MLIDTNNIVTPTVCIQQSLVFTQFVSVSIAGKLLALLDERLLVCFNLPCSVVSETLHSFRTIGSDKLECYTHSLGHY